MSKMNDELIKFVEEGFFEAGKAYTIIKSFEKYLKDFWEELLMDFDWGSYGLLPDFDSYSFVTPPKKYSGDWMLCFITIQIDNNNKKNLGLVYHPLSKKIHGYWQNEKKINFSNFKEDGIKQIKAFDGNRLEMILNDEDKNKFSLVDSYTKIITILVNHRDQLK